MTREQFISQLDAAGYKACGIPGGLDRWKRGEHNGISVYVYPTKYGNCYLCIQHHGSPDCTTTDRHTFEEAVQILKELFLL